jgi:hypothetical protein
MVQTCFSLVANFILNVPIGPAQRLARLANGTVVTGPA